MAVQHEATEAVRPVLSALAALSSLAVAVLNEHTNDADLCAVSGSAWTCEPVVLADHNLAAL